MVCLLMALKEKTLFSVLNCKAVSSLVLHGHLPVLGFSETESA